MSMVCGLDLHRQQITFDAIETRSGEVWRGRVWQPDRQRFRRWLSREVARRADGQPVAIAVEGCTGWRYVVEEITAAGFEAHLAEPADTQAARGRKRHAKTDRSDARLLRELLQSGDLPESWIPPTAVLEWRGGGGGWRRTGGLTPPWGAPRPTRIAIGPAATCPGGDRRHCAGRCSKRR